MKLEQFKNEKALEFLVDILEPTEKIFKNEKVLELVSKGGYSPYEFARVLIKTSKKEIIEILAIANDTPVDDFECDVVSIISDVLELLRFPGIQDFFRLQGQTVIASGSATESTVGTEET